MGLKEKESEEWNLNKADFEFTKELPLDSSAWSGHYEFAYDLVANVKPTSIVELGTHKGNSLFSFAQAIKDLNLKTKLHAVDTWEGDEHAGFYGEEVYETFLEIKDKYYKDVDIIPHKMLFDKAVEKFDDNSIDILHIDGLHTYDAVKHDFETWFPKVKKETGIILFHDVCEKSDDFGVHKLWDELKEKYSTLTFNHYHGLGVLPLEGSLRPGMSTKPKILIKYYEKVSETKDLIKTLNYKEELITKLRGESLVQFEKEKDYIEERENLKTQNKRLKVQNKELENSLLDTENELKKIYKSKSWRLTQPARKLVEKIKSDQT